MIISITRCKAPADRAEGPKRRPLSRAAAETLESRCLLSATPYIWSQIGYFRANDGGASPWSTLVADTAGDLFGTTTIGGTYGAGTVFEIPAGAGRLVTLASFNSRNGAYPYRSLTLDSAGNLYGTTSAGGSTNDGTVFELPAGSNNITTLASFNFEDGHDPVGCDARLRG